MLRMSLTSIALAAVGAPALAQDAPSAGRCTLDLFCAGEGDDCAAADPVGFAFDTEAGQLTLSGEALALETVMGDAAGLVLITAAAAEAPLVHAMIGGDSRVMVVISSSGGDGTFRTDGRYFGRCEGS